MPSGGGSDGSCFLLPFCPGIALPFPFTSVTDLWGPWEGAMGAGASVFGGTPGTWKDRDQREDRDGTSEVSYRVWERHPVVFDCTWLFIMPRYHNR